VTPPIRPVDLYFLLVTALMGVVRATGSRRLGRLLGRGAALAAYHLSPRKRRRGRRGLALAFGHPDPAWVRSTLAGSFVNFWEDLFLGLSLERAAPGARLILDGEGHLRAALEQGRGLILWESNSFGRRVLGREILASHGYRVVQVHVDNHLGGLHNDGLHRSWLRGRILHPLLEAWEAESLREVIYLPRDGSLAYARTLRRRLQENQIVCSAADGRWGEKAVRVPFLGGTREFSTGMVSLSRLTGAPLIPLFCWREEKTCFRVKAFAPLTHPPRTDREEATRQTLAEFARIFEDCVRSHPDQYHKWQDSEGSTGPASRTR
jgi:lauroyl/myristoyl acyltransferase